MPDEDMPSPMGGEKPFSLSTTPIDSLFHALRNLVEVANIAKAAADDDDDHEDLVAIRLRSGCTQPGLGQALTEVDVSLGAGHFAAACEGEPDAGAGSSALTRLMIG
jgi:hypothetical protein